MHTQGIPVSYALTKVLEFDNGALHGQHAVAVLVVVHWVRVALLSERQRADLIQEGCPRPHHLCFAQVGVGSGGHSTATSAS